MLNMLLLVTYLRVVKSHPYVVLFLNILQGGIMPNRVPFVKEADAIDKILAALEGSLPLGSTRTRADTAVLVIDILSRLPHEAFVTLKEAMAEYSTLPRSSQLMVLCGVRANLTRF